MIIREFIKNLPAGVLAVIFCFACTAVLHAGDAQNNNDFPEKRAEMIREQIRGRGIEDQEILDAFEKVERHRFVPERLRKYAYQDRALPIGKGQTISQPYIVALMTRAIEPEDTDRVLEIGTGSGYQAAILAELCKEVYTIEIIESLGKSAGNILSELDYANVHVRIGDGYKGWPDQAPFDAIIVTCAPDEIPDPLKQQLAEGGRMVIPVGKNYEQNLVLLEKKQGELVKKQIVPVAFVPMLNEEGDKY
ncbi:MAG: protein-L-isoaspartate(D-aspartate) O-methyltransferase [Desulfobacterales bacterium]